MNRIEDKKLKPKLFLNELLAIVSEVTGVQQYEIRGKRRVAKIRRARHLFSFIAWEHGHKKLHISKLLNQNHSTTISAINNVMFEMRLYAANKDYLTMHHLRMIIDKIEIMMIEKAIFAELEIERSLKDAS